jgi:hypothetical protein
MWIITLTGAICLAFANIDKIQRFKGAGFEAEMKNVVKEAYATIEMLKKIGKPIIINSINNLTWAGRIGAYESIDLLNKIKIIKDLENISKEINVFDNELEDYIKQFYLLHGRDFLRTIDNTLRDSQEYRSNKETIGKFIENRDTELPNINKIRDLLKPFITDNNKLIIESVLIKYEEYLANINTNALTRRLN